ncbi:L-histidine N(alpha)-methyltransferase [Chlorobium sp.]|uniref:L-histidine N(alpha)-methyltransferase n=2 Tax=Chlorobium sp. TaxID=1095 RepID=UPI0025C2E740|nr:L-histidine N(alpha)-methyltransferase [Chlorobium sp.]
MKGYMMGYSARDAIKCGSATIENHLPETGLQKTVSDILYDLYSSPKRISSKYFYDAEGSRLFTEITRLPEYYPTRTENAILRELPLDKLIGSFDIDIIELGSGDHSKIAIMLDRLLSEDLTHVRYVPVDISQSALETSIMELAGRFPGLAVQAIVADYCHQIHLLPEKRKKLFCFLGSTIGNLNRDEAMDFVRKITRTMNPGDGFLIGFDRIKETAVLEKAYNDATGVTERFNKNILRVVNRLILSDFEPDDFEHKAFYNPSERRIEMHLEAKKQLRIRCPFIEKHFELHKGESIHTENSHKFELHDILAIGAYAGLSADRLFSDNNAWFSLAYFLKTE